MLLSDTMSSPSCTVRLIPRIRRYSGVMLIEFASTEPVVITVTTSLHSHDLPDPAPEVSKSIARIYFTQTTLGPSFDLHTDAPGASRGLIETRAVKSCQMTHPCNRCRQHRCTINRTINRLHVGLQSCQ